jgi:tRNA-splicing endonuclease subunit Sen15
MAIPLDKTILVNQSPLDAAIAAQVTPESNHDQYLLYLAIQIQHNLQYQHHWTKIKLHHVSPLDGKPLPRPLISGLPPRRLYIHPDEQIEMLKLEMDRSTKISTNEEDTKTNQDSSPAEFAPEFEWVLPTHIREEWSLGRFAEIFSGIRQVPPDDEIGNKISATDESKRAKRMLLAIIQDDSTIVYYFIHDGIVKPRQN